MFLSHGMKNLEMLWVMRREDDVVRNPDEFKMDIAATRDCE
jgi:hypothetical protein